MAHKVIEHLIKCKSVAIFVHINPDWDCMGSAFALRNSLRAMNIKSDIFVNEPLSSYLGFMETDVIAYDEKAEIPDYECYCAIDVSSADRIGAWGKFFEKKDNTVCIDHHLGQNEFAKISFIEPARSATGELVFELLSQINAPITKEIASYLYCAISADTGSFQYASVNRRTYEIIIELTEAGIDAPYLCSMLYERNSLKQLQLQAEAINSITLFGDGKIATAKLSYETLEKYGAKKSDIEGLAQLPRTVEGVMLSAFLSETEKGKIRASLRAQGEYNIEPTARLFSGGGHKKAAGCTFFDTTIEEAEKLLVSELLKL